MLKSDALSQLKQLKSDIKASRNLKIGTVKGTGQKFGFVTLEETGKDVYLPPDEMQKVLPGDRVEVEIKKDGKNKNVAILERLIESEVKTFCGKYVTKGNAHFVEPDLPGMSRWIFVPPQKRKKSQAKDYVKCRMTQHPFKTGKAQAAVMEVIGAEQDKGIEWQYALSKHDVRQTWSESVESELASYDESNIEALKAQREDLTALPFVTIDSAATTDMDDALYVEKTSDGWRLFVAIADPSALIQPNSEIEKEAMARATSIYLPGQHIAMLPAKLSSDLCSLVEDKDRLAKVVTMDISSSGNIENYQITDAVIRSKQKLNYGLVSAYLETDNADELVSDEVKALLKELNQTAITLKAWRKQNALINQDRDEFFLELDDNQKVSAIHKKVLTQAHSIVEECMVAANRSAADFISQAGISSIFITHEGVRSDRLEALTSVINDRLDSDERALNKLDDFVGLVKEFAEEEEQRDLYLLIMRQLEKSRASLQASPHFGMGLPVYTTITSPIRKLNDYLLHRQISALLDKSKPEAIDSTLLNNFDQSIQTARQAVNDVEQWLKCQFMQTRKDYFSGRVLRVFTSGFQVRLDDNGIEGFVSTKEMEGKYSFHQDVLQLKGKHAAFELDQAVEVRLKQIDWTRKQMQFEVKIDEQVQVEESA